ncbi:MAG TPA: hypothetical protein VFQ22_03870, partial [Longimicrobiales bacterium]|nr:hypothetical protein [Longimicrobiales bacterium]
MFQLKRLSREGIGPARRKAERYRLLNEPWEAESICLDVLGVEPENQEALVTLVLARTDQFALDYDASVEEARSLLPRLTQEYDRLYYAGLICERRARALLERSGTGVGPVAYDWLRQAMEWYERAEAIRPAGNDDTILRWNTCARTIERHPHLRPEP